MYKVHFSVVCMRMDEAQFAVVRVCVHTYEVHFEVIFVSTFEVHLAAVRVCMYEVYFSLISVRLCGV
jgi:hypothetical protein